MGLWDAPIIPRNLDFVKQNRKDGQKMADYVERALTLISEQQKKTTARGSQWMVGEQLKDICRHEPISAELLARDLEVEKMSIVEAEKKIKAFADGHKTGFTSCVPPVDADRILREFYGLPRPEEGAIAAPGRQDMGSAPGRGMSLNLEDLLS